MFIRLIAVMPPRSVGSCQLRQVKPGLRTEGFAVAASEELKLIVDLGGQF